MVEVSTWHILPFKVILDCKGINLNNWRHWVIELRLPYAWLIKFSQLQPSETLMKRRWNYVIQTLCNDSRKFSNSKKIFSHSHLKIKSRKSQSARIIKFTEKDQSIFTRLSYWTGDARMCHWKSLDSFELRNQVWLMVSTDFGTLMNIICVKLACLWSLTLDFIASTTFLSV